MHGPHSAHTDGQPEKRETEKGRKGGIRKEETRRFVEITRFMDESLRKEVILLCCFLLLIGYTICTVLVAIVLIQLIDS